MIRAGAAVVAGSAGMIAACAPAPAPSAEGRGGAGAAAADQTATERFLEFFEQRCVVRERAGERPDTAGLVAAGGEVIARYPGVPAYQELTARELTFWTAPDDPAGDVMFVVEADEAGERCAAVTGAWSAAEFASVLRAAYPLYLPQDADERVVNARIVLDVAEGEERSKVYSIYHDPDDETSALVMTLAEAPD